MTRRPRLPYAPGATGNVCSQEIVHALELMDYDTGVDLQRLIGASKRLPVLTRARARA
jgi:hydroxymethylglutaryl-CoA lyase